MSTAKDKLIVALDVDDANRALELCELAKQNGLEVEWRLTRNKPDDRADF